MLHTERLEGELGVEVHLEPERSQDTDASDFRSLLLPVDTDGKTSSYS